jgi:hypothetical protein
MNINHGWGHFPSEDTREQKEYILYVIPNMGEAEYVPRTFDLYQFSYFKTHLLFHLKLKKGLSAIFNFLCIMISSG